MLKNAKRKLAIFFISIFILFSQNAVMPVQAMSVDDLAISYQDGGKISMGKDWEENGDQTTAWNKIFDKYKGVIVGFTGIGTLTMVILFILNFIKLGQAAGVPQKRTEALTGLLWTGLASAGLGGVTIFVAVSTNLLK